MLVKSWGMAAVISTSARVGMGLAEAVARSRSDCRALTVAGAATSSRGEGVQNHTAAMTQAVATLATIRPNAPNALRMVTFP